MLHKACSQDTGTWWNSAHPAFHDSLYHHPQHTRCHPCCASWCSAPHVEHFNAQQSPGGSAMKLDVVDISSCGTWWSSISLLACLFSAFAAGASFRQAVCTAQQRCPGCRACSQLQAGCLPCRTHVYSLQVLVIAPCIAKQACIRCWLVIAPCMVEQARIVCWAGHSSTQCGTGMHWLRGF